MLALLDWLDCWRVVKVLCVWEEDDDKVGGNYLENNNADPAWLFSSPADPLLHVMQFQTNQQVIANSPFISFFVFWNPIFILRARLTLKLPSQVQLQKRIRAIKSQSGSAPLSLLLLAKLVPWTGQALLPAVQRPSIGFVDMMWGQEGKSTTKKWGR